MNNKPKESASFWDRLFIRLKNGVDKFLYYDNLFDDNVWNVRFSKDKKEKIKYKDKFVYTTDTLYKDSIQYVDRKETVEKKYIPKWCYYSLVGWILLLIFAIYKIYKWLR